MSKERDEQSVDKLYKKSEVNVKLEIKNFKLFEIF